MISGSVILGFTIAICLLLSSIAVESLRGSSRILLDEELREERKQQKRDHWKLTQLMDYGEKVKDAFTRRSQYERRVKDKEKRIEEWEARKNEDPHEIKMNEKIRDAYKSKQLMNRRDENKDERMRTYVQTGHATDWKEKEERLATKTKGQPMVNLEDITTEQLVVLFEELSFYNCDDELRKNKVDGEALSKVTSWADLEKKHLLILPTNAAKVLYSKIDTFRADGVPKNLITDLPEIHSHLLKKHDGSKKVYCKSTTPDPLQDGTTAPFAYLP